MQAPPIPIPNQAAVTQLSPVQAPPAPSLPMQAPPAPSQPVPSPPMQAPPVPLQNPVHNQPPLVQKQTKTSSVKDLLSFRKIMYLQQWIIK